MSEVADAGDVGYAAFGEAFLRRVLHLRRVLDSIDRILGRDFALGPMGAGPGRRVARLTATGRYRPTYGEELPGAEVAYRVWVPVAVTFAVDLRVDTARFHADVAVPLTVTLRIDEPLTVVWDIDLPAEQDVRIELTSDTRRSVVMQKLAGMDQELRRFLLRFVERELDKPHVRRARRIALDEVIDGAWPQIADQFLPPDREGRTLTASPAAESAGP